MPTRDVAEHLRFYHELGVTGVSRDPRWRARAESGSASGSAVADQETGTSAGTGDRAEPAANADPPATAVETLTLIREDLGECVRCKLSGLGRRQIVFGTGNPTADLMFVGEAPGADEDAQGVPFVGRAGQLLTKMIEAMGFARDEVYIANVLKCRPPGNRDPEPDEVARCKPFLLRQVASVGPKVIVTLGAFASRALLDTDVPISRLRGRIHDFHGAPLIPTFHPSFLLRSPGYQREAWEDLKKALEILGRTPPAAPPARG